jgi:hypothetical protein
MVMINLLQLRDCIFIRLPLTAADPDIRETFLERHWKPTIIYPIVGKVRGFMAVG